MTTDEELDRLDDEKPFRPPLHDKTARTLLTLVHLAAQSLGWKPGDVTYGKQGGDTRLGIVSPDGIRLLRFKVQEEVNLDAEHRARHVAEKDDTERKGEALDAVRRVLKDGGYEVRESVRHGEQASAVVIRNPNAKDTDANNAEARAANAEEEKRLGREDCDDYGDPR